MDLWTKSLDDWDNPLRPANLIEGTYKGGRRPLDLYWRIAKGINGAKMPAHAGLLTDDQIWDVVNFVLALPDDPDLLPESPPDPAGPAKAHAVRHVALIGSIVDPTASQGAIVRYWSLLFGLVGLACVACFAYAPFDPEWWLPAGPDTKVSHLHSASTAGKEIDALFVIILWITGRRLHRHPGRPGLGGLEVRRRPGADRGLLPRQPAARADLDDHPGDLPGLHHGLPVRDLGERQVQERRAQRRRRWPRSPAGSSSG